MEESEEMHWLKAHWNREFLGDYTNKWIAVFRNEIIAYGEDIPTINESIPNLGDDHLTPLFAYIYFGRIQ